MRVCYLHQHFSTPAGSAGNRSYQMAKALIAENHAVTMICGSYGGAVTGLDGPFIRGVRRGKVDGIDVIECDLPYANTQGFLTRSIVFLRFMLRTIGLVLREDYDVLFATTTPLTVGVPGIIGRWFRRKPFVFEVRDLWPELPKAMGAITNPVVLWLLAILEWASYRSAHRLIGLAPGIVDGIVRHGIEPTRVALIPNGCDFSVFATDTAVRPDTASATDLVAIYAGTHGYANALGNVLNAAAVLASRGRDDIKFLLIGSGAEKAALVERAKIQGLANVIFLAPMPKSELARYVAGADVGLQLLANIPAFYFGTSPNKFFDYISAGLPVLCNYPGWIAEMIAEHECGRAVAPANADAFADALESLAAQRAQLPQLGSNARHLAESEFDRAKLSQDWVAWVTGANA